MFSNEKIMSSLKSALAYVENALTALTGANENMFDDSLWHVGAELEYALFLFSMAFKSEKEGFQPKNRSEIKNVEDDQLLVRAQTLLKEAEGFMADRRLLDAYRSAYEARHYVFMLQENLAKRKRRMHKRK
ncbi:MAG: hypothetical protein ACUVUE_04940 [Candidatus Bathycorpusculaceae bacterium]